MSHITSLSGNEWLPMILFPSKLLGINPDEEWSFSLFASILIDCVWYSRNPNLPHPVGSPNPQILQVPHGSKGGKGSTKCQCHL